METKAPWFPVVREELRRRYPGVRIVQWEEFGLTHGAHEHEVILTLPEKLQQKGVTAAISALGA